MEPDINFAASVIAGLLSFFSPCILPLFGSYLFFISGNAGENSIKTRAFSALFFVFGFTCVFVVLSAALYSVFLFVPRLSVILRFISGAVIILLGINFIFPFIPFLKYDDTAERCDTCTPQNSILAVKEKSILHPSRRPSGFAGSFLAGLAFGAGWTPCVGAFLSSVLLMAAQSETIGRAVFYLTAYSAGLGLPFIITSVFWGAVLKKLSRFNRVKPVLKIASGIFLAGFGVIILSGKSFLLSAWLQAL